MQVFERLFAPEGNGFIAVKKRNKQWLDDFAAGHARQRFDNCVSYRHCRLTEPKNQKIHRKFDIKMRQGFDGTNSGVIVAVMIDNIEKIAH